MIAVQPTVPVVEQGTKFTALSAVALNVWHKRFGHAHHSVIKKMKSENSVIGLDMSEKLVDTIPCKSRAFGKSHRHSFPKTGRRRATGIGEIIHSDLVVR